MASYRGPCLNAELTDIQLYPHVCNNSNSRRTGTAISEAGCQMPTFPGVHPNLNFHAFDRDEAKIIGFLAKSFYLTQASSVLVGNSTYRFVLSRPADLIQHVLNYDREIVVLFSPYETFEARSLESYRQIEQRFPAVRLERTIRFFFSRDRKIVEKIDRFLSQNQDFPILCAFYYDDFQSISTVQNMAESIRQLFFSRDLFNNQNPLRSERFFFGRSDLLKNIIDRHISGENSGLFGLRRTGKTSFLNGLARTARAVRQPYLQVDCQTTSVHMKRWFELLSTLASNIATATSVRMPEGIDFTEKAAADSFQQVAKIISKRHNARVLIAFDEIENISPRTSPSAHWQTGQDALLFWQTIRSICQTDPSPLGFVLVGINPGLVENVRLCGFDNPLFNFVKIDYIKGFTTEQTHEMCSTLGNIMGLEFSLDASYALSTHFGGNPYLIRQAGSKIHDITRTERRPIKVTQILAEQAADSMERSAAVYATGMLEVLKQFYPDEFELLCWLSIGNVRDFNSYIAQEPLAIDHLEGYGVIDRDMGMYSFRVKIFSESIKQFIRDRPDLISQERRREFIVNSRTEIEQSFRMATRTLAVSKFGKADALARIVTCLTAKRQSDLKNATFDDVFSVNKSRLFLSDFFAIINLLELEFERLSGVSSTEIKAALGDINSTRYDAHSNDIDDEDFTRFKAAWVKLKAAMDPS